MASKKPKASKPEAGKRARKAILAKSAREIVKTSAANPAIGGLPAGYPALLEDIKARIRTAQIKASLAVNRELIALYWSIGRDIVQRQREEGWGKSVVERLANDIQTEFPGIGGFSVANIWRMRGFYLAWAKPYLARPARDSQEGEILAQPVRELETGAISAQTGPKLKGKILKQPAPDLPPGRRAENLAQPVRELDRSILPQPVAEIPWGHNILLLQKLKDPARRIWYARQTIANGWSRSMLLHWIESDLYARQGKAVTNFQAALPPPQSDLAAELVKDPYTFDFLTLRRGAAERDLERGLLDHIRKFLLELGAGFAFVGRQVHLEVGGEDFYIDLLFYHLHLRCYIVIDLKARPFKPEYAGKMNFYLSAVDDLLRHADDKPSIGLILCKTRNKVVAEYALRDVAKPVGIARYVTRLVESLPARFKGALPAPRDIEAELRKDE
jgi:predicted nuclease of restriction endonuclease-like (RecB) superfamily